MYESVGREGSNRAGVDALFSQPAHPLSAVLPTGTPVVPAMEACKRARLVFCADSLFSSLGCRFRFSLQGAPQIYIDLAFH